jgi:hypothetical protein
MQGPMTHDTHEALQRMRVVVGRSVHQYAVTYLAKNVPLFGNIWLSTATRTTRDWPGRGIRNRVTETSRKQQLEIETVQRWLPHWGYADIFHMCHGQAPEHEQRIR